MINPKSVFLVTPVIDARVDVMYAGGILQCAAAHRFASNMFLVGQSNIALARNMLAHAFLATPLEWCVWIDSDIGFNLRDWDYLMEGDDLLVTAEYSQKTANPKPVTFGMGFVRTHRSVFEKMAAMRTEDGQERLMRFRTEGQEMVDFFINGATADMRWLGEDTGFWINTRLAEVPHRIERRTQLTHYGRAAYPYISAEHFGGQ